jgi:hypothetical protein
MEKVNNLELSRNGCVATVGPANSGSEYTENSRNAEEIGAEESSARSGRIWNAIPRSRYVPSLPSDPLMGLAPTHLALTG